MSRTKPYTWKSALFDLIMIALFGPFWIAWVIVRYLRTH